MHNYPLGFGGPRRPDQPLSWAENKNRDWPHGTGPTYPVPSYVAATPAPVPQETGALAELDDDSVVEFNNRRIFIDSQGNATFVKD